jgi:hypothetical protein
VANVDRVFQVERFDERCEVVGIGIQVVAVPGLAGPTIPTTVMGDLLS